MMLHAPPTTASLFWFYYSDQNNVSNWFRSNEDEAELFYTIVQAHLPYPLMFAQSADIARITSLRGTGVSYLYL